MGNEYLPLLIFGMIGVGLLVLFLSRGLDRSRIERYLARQRATLLSCVWAPLGPGWFGEKDARIYKITYRDEQGQIHEAHVKTSMHSGVYLTEDRVIDSGPRRSIPATNTISPRRTSEPKNQDEVEAEKRRLRARLAELEARYPTGE